MPPSTCWRGRRSRRRPPDHGPRVTPSAGSGRTPARSSARSGRRRPSGWPARPHGQRSHPPAAEPARAARRPPQRPHLRGRAGGAGRVVGRPAPRRGVMRAVAADTHAVLWYLEDDPRLTATAGTALDGADRILLPSVCLVEITYLVEKGRLDAAVLPRLFAELDDPATTLALAPLDLGVVLALQDVPACPCRTCRTGSSRPPPGTTACPSSLATARSGRPSSKPSGSPSGGLRSLHSGSGGPTTPAAAGHSAARPESRCNHPHHARWDICWTGLST